MAQDKKWRDEVVDVLNGLGGKAHLSQIYDKIKERGIMNFEENPNWQAAIRRTIEERSSDSKFYKNGSEDLFYSVKGIGKGEWGLRDQ